MQTKAAVDKAKVFRNFMGLEAQPQVAHAAGSGEFKKALEELGLFQTTATLRRRDTAEQATKRVKRGAQSVLAASGLPLCFGTMLVEHNVIWVTCMTKRMHLAPGQRTGPKLASEFSWGITQCQMVDLPENI